MNVLRWDIDNWDRGYVYADYQASSVRDGASVGASVRDGITVSSVTLGSAVISHQVVYP